MHGALFLLHLCAYTAHTGLYFVALHHMFNYEGTLFPNLNVIKVLAIIQSYSKVPPELPNSTAQQPRQTRQKGAYQ